MRLRMRLQPDGYWLEHELVRQEWTYQDLARHAGISRMTLYFLRHPGEYGAARKRRSGRVNLPTARAIAVALVGPEGDIDAFLARYFEVERTGSACSA